MDPAVEGLQFGAAILSGGFVAVVAALLTFRYGQRLQRERDARIEMALRRALVAEIRENIRRLGGGDQVTAVPLVPLLRTAWDQARGSVTLPADAFDAIVAGHQAGTYAHEVTTVLQIVMSRPWSFFEKLKVPALTRSQIEAAQSQSRVARQCFASALAALGERAEAD